MAYPTTYLHDIYVKCSVLNLYAWILCSESYDSTSELMVVRWRRKMLINGQMVDKNDKASNLEWEGGCVLFYYYFFYYCKQYIVIKLCLVNRFIDVTEEAEGEIKNGQSWDTGNLWHKTKHKEGQSRMDNHETQATFDTRQSTKSNWRKG